MSKYNSYYPLNEEKLLQTICILNSWGRYRCQYSCRRLVSPAMGHSLQHWNGIII